MQMVMVVWYWLIHWRQIGIDDQVMMTRIRFLNASRCDARAAQSHADPESTFDHLSIRRPEDVDPGILRHGGLLRDGGGPNEDDRGQRSHKDPGSSHGFSCAADDDRLPDK
jgi:hypothetical protein